MYIVSNNTAYINGSSGIYDGKIENPSVRYGRNALNNYNDYLSNYTIKNGAEFPNLKDGITDEKLDQLEYVIDKTSAWIDNMPPVDFKYRYMPESTKVDTQALLGAAYEEMGKRTEIDRDELTDNLTEAFGEGFSANALDIDGDGKIDIGEYSTSILLSDIESSENKLVDGVITNKGQNKALPYTLDKNYKIAHDTYKALYETYDIGSARREFLNNSNNLI